MLKTALIRDSVSRYVDIKYLLRFTILYLLLYFFNLSVEALQNGPGLVYSYFIDHYLNYVHLEKLSILYTAQTIASQLGIYSSLGGEYVLSLPNGTAVQMYYACAGFGMMSFWAAFIMAHDGKVKKRVLWTIAGLLLIWVVNCLRFTFILYTLNKDGELTRGFDHHAVFNIGSYIVIGALGWAFYRVDKTAV